MEDDEQVIKTKKKYNRRSSFFQRRLSSYKSDSPTSTYTTSTIPASECDTTVTTETIADEYLSKLKKEKEDWNDLLNKIRKEERELSEKCPEVASAVDFLSAEDKKFLEDRPEYTAIGRLADSVTESVMIKQQRINSTMAKIDSLINHCEQITKEVVGDVIVNFMEDYDEFNGIPPPS